MQASRLLFPKGGLSGSGVFREEYLPGNSSEFSMKNISPETPLHTTCSIYFYTNTEVEV
ncbi:hypothetical protein [Calothrix sp. UHCC 0171]|uniref:hypothetical protein n=1 Tax=Calothrix sp. UHCC 0171 TaxID=3110245 RepID=UPI002B1F0EC9|nr:hypothetical protein [Calothrix sp. UHCC 0171]MEA5573937.1 hypothetical protein [Calothrix sp. UHCC 0171]